MHKSPYVISAPLYIYEVVLISKQIPQSLTFVSYQPKQETAMAGSSDITTVWILGSASPSFTVDVMEMKTISSP